MSVHRQQLQFHTWLREHVRQCPACGHAGRAGQAWFVITSDTHMAPPSDDQPYSEPHLLSASCRECGHSARYDLTHVMPAGRT